MSLLLALFDPATVLGWLSLLVVGIASRTFPVPVVTQEDLGTGTTGTESFDLPTDRPVSRLWLRHRATHATAIDVDVNRVDVKADGESPIFGNLEGTFARGLAKYWTGREPTRDAGTPADFETWIYLQFGRVPGDRAVFLPSPIFNSVKLAYEWDTNGVTPVVNEVDIWIEELRDVDPTKGFMKRVRRADTFDPTAHPNRQTVFKGGRNVRLASVYIDDDGDLDNLGGADPASRDTIALTHSAGEREVFVGHVNFLQEMQRIYYGFHDDARPTDLNAIPVDVLQNIQDAVALENRPTLRIEPDTANASGEVKVYSEEYVPLA